MLKQIISNIFIYLIMLDIIAAIIFFKIINGIKKILEIIYIYIYI